MNRYCWVKQAIANAEGWTLVLAADGDTLDLLLADYRHVEQIHFVVRGAGQRNLEFEVDWLRKLVEHDIELSIHVGTDARFMPACIGSLYDPARSNLDDAD